MERKELRAGSVQSRLAFELKQGSVIGLRYLLVDGKRAYDLGSTCQTCSFLFQRLAGANQSLEIGRTCETLRLGVRSLDDEVVETIAGGMPEDHYIVMRGEATVELVQPGGKEDYFCVEQPALWGEDNFWCLPHDPRVPYFRAGSVDLGETRRLFNFVVPMYPTKWLQFLPLAQYAEQIRTLGSGTAVFLSLLDVKAPALFQGDVIPDPTEHWCFTHYVIDGHHKLHAAYEAGRPIQFLSFVALSKGVSTPDDVKTALKHLPD
jgi:hypothetical protein